MCPARNTSHDHYQGQRARAPLMGAWLACPCIPPCACEHGPKRPQHSHAWSFACPERCGRCLMSPCKRSMSTCQPCRSSLTSFRPRPKALEACVSGCKRTVVDRFADLRPNYQVLSGVSQWHSRPLAQPCNRGAHACLAGLTGISCKCVGRMSALNEWLCWPDRSKAAQISHATFVWFARPAGLALFSLKAQQETSGALTKPLHECAPMAATTDRSVQQRVYIWKPMCPCRTGGGIAGPLALMSVGCSCKDHSPCSKGRVLTDGPHCKLSMPQPTRHIQRMDVC